MISGINMVRGEESKELQKTDPNTDLLSEMAPNESFTA
jgi:hypothetical protein